MFSFKRINSLIKKEVGFFFFCLLEVVYFQTLRPDAILVYTTLTFMETVSPALTALLLICTHVQHSSQRTVKRFRGEEQE